MRGSLRRGRRAVRPPDPAPVVAEAPWTAELRRVEAGRLGVGADDGGARHGTVRAAHGFSPANLPTVASPIDTHAAVQDLEKAGVERPVAEAIVSTVVRADSGFARRSDLDAAIAGMRARMATLGRRLVLASLVIAGLLFTAIRFFG